MAAFLRGIRASRRNVKLSQARATINGDTPLQLWAKNPVSFAVGAEYRKYHVAHRARRACRSRASSAASARSAAGSPVASTSTKASPKSSRRSSSDRPFFEELQIEGGIRRSHYTIAAPSEPEVQHHHLEDRRQLGAGSGHQVPRRLQPRRSCAEHLRAVHASFERPDEPCGRSVRRPRADHQPGAGCGLYRSGCAGGADRIDHQPDRGTGQRRPSPATST